MKRIFFALLISTLGFAGPAMADKSTRLGTYKDWSSYTFLEQGSQVCYSASQPTKSAGDYKKRDDIFVFITHRPSAKEFNVVSFLAGYDYKSDSEVTVDVDGKKTFTLFVQGDRAWAADTATDAAIVEAMKKGKKLTVKGTSKRGTLTTDTYSLYGVSKALKAIDSSCQ